MRKKSDLFNVHMKKVAKSDGSLAIVCNYCSKSSGGRNPEITAHIDDISTILIPPKLRNQRQMVKRKFSGTRSEERRVGKEC